MTRKHAAMIICGVAIALTLTACNPNAPTSPTSISPSGRSGTGSSIDPGSPNAIWPFWPVEMKIHPLTRLTKEDKTGRDMLEARVEFVDAQGNRSKAVGTVLLALYDAAIAPNQAIPIHEWSQDLRGIAINNQHFDIVTQTYLLRLEVDLELLPAEAELRVTFHSINDQNMQASKKIKRPNV